MAIIRTGPIVGAISGTVGSVVFVNRKRGAVLRPRPSTVAKSSPFLATARANFHNVRRRWATLTTAQQKSWRTAAALIPHTNRLGAQSPSSGFAFFVKVNLEIIGIAQDTLNDPLPAGKSKNVPNVGATFSEAGTYSITGFALDAPISARYWHFGWPLWRDTPAHFQPPPVLLNSFVAIGPTGNVKNQWIEHFGALREGQQFIVAIAGRLSIHYRSDLAVFQGTVVA